MTNLCSCFAAKRAIILAALLPLMGGCATPRSDPNTIVLTSGMEFHQRLAYANAKRRFERENPGKHLKIIEIWGGDYYTKLQVMFAGSSEPDICWLGQGLGGFASKGQLADLTPFVKREPASFLTRFNKTALDAYRWGDKLFGLPNGLDCQLLYYNKDIFDRYKVPYPTADWTSDDLVTAAKKLTHASGKMEDVYGLVAGINPMSCGVRQVTKDGRKCLIDSPETRFYMRWAKDVVYKYKISPEGSAPISTGMTEDMAFTMGRAAMAGLYTWNLTTVVKSADFRWGMAPIPKMFGGKRSIWTSTSGFSIVESSKKKELAWKLLQILVSPEFSKDIYPANIAADEKVMIKLLKADKSLPPTVATSMVESIDAFYVPPRTTTLSQLDIKLGNAAEKYIRDKLTLEEAVAEAKKNMEKVIKEDQEQ